MTLLFLIDLNIYQLCYSYHHRILFENQQIFLKALLLAAIQFNLRLQEK
jgi:hypothetical protein